VEHDVSLVSARAVLNNLDPARYEVVPIGVSREGRWVTSGDARGLLDGGLARSAGTRAVLTGDPSIGGLVTLDGGGAPMMFDVAFPLIHGTGGEDGTLQGLLELSGIPYVGSGVLGSSLGMDKAASKVIFRAAGLPMAEYLVVSRHRIETDAASVAREVEKRFGYPCFTKPSNGGSSVGVSKVKRVEELPAALTEAASYDCRVVIEQGIEGQEVECAVLGGDDPKASVVGEIVPGREFYDYSAKYLEDTSQLLIPARIGKAQAEEIRAMSIAAFEALSLSGLARVDFFVKKSNGAVLINEVNTLPGFTPISMYPRLWEASGVSFSALIDRLIEIAFARHAQKMALKTDYAPGQKAPGTR
jgi:D-alanine-D-alanine ligase